MSLISRKTEAYLMLVAFVIAYRRRLGLAEGSPMKGIGTAVLTRYTLRLLTIQQFRRTLSVITACEFLRVSSSDSGTIGWNNIRAGRMTIIAKLPNINMLTNGRISRLLRNTKLLKRIEN